MRRHRRAARLTLEQLAEASGVSARTVSDMERGRSTGPQHRTVVALARALSLGEEDSQRLIDWAREGRLRDHWTRPTGLAELPRSVDDFTGRAAELAWADDFMRAGDTPGAAGVALITGAAGLGKTTFAVRAAHVLRPNFTDGVLFVDLFGMSAQPLPAQDALTLLLRALGTTDRDMPPAPLERASLYRSLLRERRVLVVLDNAASEEQLRPLLPGGGSSRVLATSRRLLAGLEGVHRLSLGPLPPDEAAELLTGIVGRRGSSDGESAIGELAEFCAGLPLALRIVGNRLVSRPNWPVAEFADRLADEERRLDQFRAGDLKIATAFGMSYQQLASLSQQVFRRLSLVPGRDFDADLAAVLGGVPVADAWDALDDLVDLGLLQDSTSGRYRFHDLVRLFARDRLKEEEPAEDRDALAERMTAWLLQTATTAGRWFEPAYARPDRPDTHLSSPDEAERWLHENAGNWLGALRQAAASGLHSVVLDCAESMRWFSGRWMHWPYWQEVFTLGAEAATALDDPAYQAPQLTHLAQLHMVPPPDPETMLRYAVEALDLATKKGARPPQLAWAHMHHGRALMRLGRFGEAVEPVSEAARLFKTAGDVDVYCQCLGTIGECRRGEGDYAAALELYLEMAALTGDEGSGMTPSIAALSLPNALAGAGLCLELLGRRAAAIEKYTEANTLFERQPPSGSYARSQQRLAIVLAEEGRTGESRHAYARAAELFEATGDAESADRCRALAAGAT
ncbi:helix-turn-helix domain-containing protein [Nonomuraea endophytica]|nr:helix-turn-helix domain-containing protein [Nonomuraea endophytica]